MDKNEKFAAYRKRKREELARLRANDLAWRKVCDAFRERPAMTAQEFRALFGGQVDAPTT